MNGNNEENYERLTRKQYREQQKKTSQKEETKLNNDDVDVNEGNLGFEKEDKNSRHNRISKKLNWIILYLCMGIIIVFLILFFFNP
ncbi:DUF846 domain-containing protein [Apilactobacillus ozensis]|uniref:DUF846 domain-containing protein n=1 Tax=Apilactobacillus ozensis TaxID=866801 RepID=UPI00200A220F|nr:DUF846 domain-containing protein [Apilactobacillus ozensis]MCK8607298.1 DUF846 domain-containing protein [Apilactobacillus ozensis]